MQQHSSQRHLFDIPRDVAYFNSAYNAPQLLRSKELLIQGAAEKCHPWKRKPEDFFKEAEQVRRLAASALGGDSEGYAVVPSASYGMSTAARAIEPLLGKGDRIVVIDEAFPSNYLPWQRTANERGALLCIAKRSSGENWTQAILKQIRPGVRAVAVPPCHWTDGTRIDLVQVAQACRSVGALLAIDATQSLGAVPFDFNTIQPDFLVASGYKWLLCPYGFSLFYIAPRWRDARPLEESWLARENAENFASLIDYSDTYLPGARRFDMGEKNSATLLPGAIAALEQIEAWGVERISAILAQINNSIAATLEKAGFTLPDPLERSPHMFGASHPYKNVSAIVAHLTEERIYVSQRGRSLRIAPHLHVDNYDLERLCEGITKSAQ